jgi:hypothetical protein
MNKRYLANCNFTYYSVLGYFSQVFVSFIVLGVGLHSVFFSRLDSFLLCNPAKCNNYSTGLCQYNHNLLFVFWLTAFSRMAYGVPMLNQ